MATRTTVLLCLAAFMTMLDLFIVNVAFESISGSYPTASLPALSWVLNGYIVVYAACLIPAGRLADRYGRKRGFVAGLALFTLASVGCAVAPTLGVLVAARLAQALGAAVLTPTSLGLLLSVLPEDRRDGAVKIWATCSSFAGALGPVVGGLLAESSWRWAFLINLPIGVATAVLVIRTIPAGSPSSSTRMPDPLGVIAIALAIGAVSVLLVNAGDWGWTSAPSAFAAVVAGASTLVLVHRVRTHPTPIMPPTLFRLRGFTVANATIILFTSAFSALFLSVSLWLEVAADYGPLQAGLALAPGPLVVIACAALTQRFAAKAPPRVIVAAGLAVFACGALLLAISGGGTYSTDVLPGWITTAVGIGIAMPTLIGSATAGLTPDTAATGSAVVNTARQAGYALGIAGLVAVLGEVRPSATGSGFVVGWILVAVLAATAAGTAVGIRPRTADSRHRQ
ncbi:MULTISPECIES: MFS transporter [Tsukamurella]|uniref:MFS transporter n=2 Tax=Tsukamurella TaxID=2060 RepID=A0A5C5S115_9ACTN|nr:MULTISPECIES: MFS transporter [Tsukamurella]NMD54291.1 MFS transporter [Tsukamurella columbiensis]TWS28363.1 MFS transporter [Tsukamurella conjunctivitidis]